VLVDAGRNYVARITTQQLTPLTLTMGLYTNAVTWGRGTLLTDLAEVAVSGYGRQDTGPWQVPTVLAGGEASTTAPSVAFHNNAAAPVVVVGFFYTTSDGAFFLGGDAFASPLTIPASGGVLNVFPQIVDTTYP